MKILVYMFFRYTYLHLYCRFSMLSMETRIMVQKIFHVQHNIIRKRDFLGIEKIIDKNFHAKFYMSNDVNAFYQMLIDRF